MMVEMRKWSIMMVTPVILEEGVRVMLKDIRRFHLVLNPIPIYRIR